MMKKIVLLCNMGMSTGALMTRMRKHAASIGLECTINAYPVSEAVKVAADADCILIGPQIAYQLKQVQEKLPNVPCETIPMKDYGMMDAPKVIEQAKRLMGV